MIGAKSDLVKPIIKPILKRGQRRIIHAHVVRVWTFTAILSIFPCNRATRRPYYPFCQSRPK